MGFRREPVHSPRSKLDEMSSLLQVHTETESAQKTPADYMPGTCFSNSECQPADDSEKANINGQVWKGAVRVRASQRHTMRPIAPALQTAMPRWFERRFPQTWKKALVFLGLLLTWGLTFSSFSKKHIPPMRVGNSYVPVRELTCTDSFWLPDNRCGIDGEKCPEFEGPVAFRCPANCGGVKLRKPHIVGGQTIVNQPLVIGGSIYRADSWICAAAVHSDVLEAPKGGCGALNRMGQTNTFPSSRLNGIVSIAVKTYFPQSFMFVRGSGFDCEPIDQRWLLPYVSVVFTALVFLFSSNSPAASAISFVTAYVVGIVYDTYASADYSSADTSHSHGDGASSHGDSALLRFMVLSKYLLGLTCAVLVYRRSVRRMFHKLAAPVEKTVLWLGGFWAMNLLLSQDIAPEHEKMAAAVAPCVLICAAAHHMHQLRREGRLCRPFLLLPAYVALLLAVAVIMLTLTPSVHRHHEAVLAFLLLLLPGAGAATRPNLLLGGLLVGLLAHGVAHHQQQHPQGLTPADLATMATTAVTAAAGAGRPLMPLSPAVVVDPHRDHHQLAIPVAGSLGPARHRLSPAYPEMHEPEILIGDATSNITFAWKQTYVTPTDAADGISMLVNDVERARWYFDGRRAGRPLETDDEDDIDDIKGTTFQWGRTPQAVVDYFRFSWVLGDKILGYGDASVWEVTGEFRPRVDSQVL